MSILELECVTKSFDGIKAVNNISLGFNKGKITALIGPNGAGKTTIFNLISGFVQPDEGKIFYKNEIITGYSPWQIALMGIGRVFQDIRLFQRMTVLDNVLTAFKKQIGENFLISTFTRWKVIEEEQALKNRSMEHLELVGLSNKANDLGENLSYGEQKLLAIARLLAADSDLILLDEPTAGVNPKMIGKLIELIRKIASQGKTVLIIEHNMNVIVEIADWVFFIDDGTVISFGLPDDVLDDPEVRKAYIGI